MTIKVLLMAVVGAATVLATVSGADADPRKRRSGDDGGVVKVCSIYGNGCTSAPTRRGSVGYEFRMPGGTWVNCRLDCKTALREETVDFWETQRERAGDAFM
jgi:hypothetical protein